MDQKAVAFARSWARRYVRTKHPHGLDVEDVENRILESLYKYSRGKMNGRDSARPSQDGEAVAPQWMMKALSEALNDIQNESRRNLRALCPWQVRNAEPHLAAHNLQTFKLQIMRGKCPGKRPGIFFSQTILHLNAGNGILRTLTFRSIVGL